ncbi:hypothetical protein ACEPAI_334 [Sanghuangporus weigelae]
MPGGPWFANYRHFDFAAMSLPLNAHRPDSHTGQTWAKSLHRRRQSKLCFAALLCSSLLYFLWFIGLLAPPVAILKSTLGQVQPVEPTTPVTPPIEDPPPLYEQWYEFERHLPQQNESLPYPEGADAQFLYASNHVWGLGFNNALQEQLFLSHLAYIANKTYVFDVYTWNYDLNESYTYHYGRWIPSRIPFTAFIAGPTVGGSFGKGDPAPRAVSKPYYEKMCPEPTLIRSNEVNDGLGSDPDASVMMQAWAETLKETSSKCIEVGNSDQVFSFMVFGDGQRVLPFLDEFLNSPVLKRFAWSTLVNDAVLANMYLFDESLSPVGRPSSPIRLLQPDDEPESGTQIPGLLAIHVRRGDYEEHCQNLARWGSRFMGWLQSPLIIDRFEPPSAESDDDDEAIRDYYMAKCWPDMDQIVLKINEVRWTPQGRGLKRVYIMTNGPTEWVAELKAKIMGLGGWDGALSGDDLTLIPEQKYIGQAIDMALAMRSQVFIGNGFSSLSANVVILRLSRHFDPLTNRLW